MQYSGVFPFRLQLLGRFGTLEECGLVCLFLAADATFCTGIDIPVSGGAELNYGNKNMQAKENPFGWKAGSAGLKAGPLPDLVPSAATRDCFILAFICS